MYYKCWKTDNCITLSASFSRLFDKSQADAVMAVAKDAMATVTGKIGKGTVDAELKECGFAE